MNKIPSNPWRDDPQVWENRFDLKVAYSFPPGHRLKTGELYPILCFLHGYKECELGKDHGKTIVQAMSDHGPLADNASPIGRESFIIVCPQLKYPGGNIWYDQRSKVLKIVKAMHEYEQGNPNATFLTGFSHGGHGVFDIAEELSGIRWKALWAVDPTRPPTEKPIIPTWLSASREARKSVGAYRRMGFSFQEKNPATIGL